MAEITLTGIRHLPDGSIEPIPITIDPDDPENPKPRRKRVDSWVPAAIFLKRFSLDQYAAVRQFANQQLATNPQWYLWIDTVTAAGGLDVSSDAAVAAKVAFVAADLLPQDDADAIFAPVGPS
jgi:hypothetical protein